MDTHWFDVVSKDTLAQRRLRRSVVTGLAGGVLTLAAGGSGAFGAKDDKPKKRKKKPLKRNEYGCVADGKACRGNDAVCCSGICQGKKPKKGERDQSQCVGHDASTCVRGQATEFCNPAGVTTHCTSSTGQPGVCETTTGNSGICASTGSCEECRNDADCQISTGNPHAACVRCASGFCMAGTACVAP